MNMPLVTYRFAFSDGLMPSGILEGRVVMIYDFVERTMRLRRGSVFVVCGRWRTNRLRQDWMV